jgi:hypothetical protein
VANQRCPNKRLNDREAKKNCLSASAICAGGLVPTDDTG